MDPKATQSGQFVGTDNKISKRGSPYLRRAVYIAANIAKIHDPVFKEHYERLVARGKHPKQALTAVATKLLRVVHAVMVKQVPYSPALKQQAMISFCTFFALFHLLFLLRPLDFF
jgi:hypothetical protein